MFNTESNFDTWNSYTHGLFSLLGQGHLDAVAEFLPGTTLISCPGDGLCPRLSAQGHMCLGLLPGEVLTEAASESASMPASPSRSSKLPWRSKHSWRLC